MLQKREWRRYQDWRRNDSGLSNLDQAGDFFGGNRRTMIRWENGQTKVPDSAVKLAAMMDHYSLTPEKVDKITDRFVQKLRSR